MDHHRPGLVEMSREIRHEVIEFDVSQEASVEDLPSRNLRERQQLGVKGISPMPEVDVRLHPDVAEPIRAQQSWQATPNEGILAVLLVNRLIHAQELPPCGMEWLTRPGIPIHLLDNHEPPGRTTATISDRMRSG
jgi:hypothetical protein